MIKTLGVKLIDFAESSVEEILGYFEDKEEMQVDTETTGSNPHRDKIISLQLGDRLHQFFIDCRRVDILLFKDLIERKKCLLQNSKFDYKMLKMAGIDLENIWDTMLAEVVSYCGYNDWGYSLDKLVDRYLGIDMSKLVRASFLSQGDKPFTKEQVEYGCLDVTYLQDIRDKQMIRIKDLDLEYCVNLECQAIKALGDMEINGMEFCPEEWLALTEEEKLEAARLEKELDDILQTDEKLIEKYKPKAIQQNLFGFEERYVTTNYRSPKQIKAILKELDFSVESTAVRELKKISKKHDFPKKLQELRKKEKNISTYGEGFLENINPVTKRIHTDFWPIVETGRVSSRDPNMQNIPSKEVEVNGIKLYPFRKCFKAPPGYKFVSGDYSGQELRIMADKSGEKGFIDVLNSGEDLHCYAGSMMFGKTITKKDKAERTKAKTINFGKPYGMGPAKLADELDITIEEADKLFMLYAKKFPVLNKWLEEQGKFAKRNEYSLTFAPCKRRRFYPEMAEAKRLRKIVQSGDKATWKKILTIEGSTEREGGNSPIQGTGADICKEALIVVRELIKQYNKEYGADTVQMVLTVHDEIDCVAKEEIAEKFGQEMKKLMIEAGNKYVDKVSMEVDLTITDFWTK